MIEAYPLYWPLHCAYCGRLRSRDPVGHYCKTKNCQWQHGYKTCPVQSRRAGGGMRKP